MSVPIEVTHFVDPGCPWDYSAEPVRVALEERYGDQLTWRNVQVGVYQSSEVMARRGDTTSGLVESYRIFQERYGMPFCIEEGPRLVGSWPAARAIKAAERQSPKAGATLLRRLRLARFVEALLVDEGDEILQLAGQIETLDLRRFGADLDSKESADDFERDMVETRRPDRVARGLKKTAQPSGDPGPRYVTPTYRFAVEGRSATVPGFQPLEAYEVALHNLASTVERRPVTDAAEFLRGRAGEPYAVPEIAAGIGHSKQRASEQLERLVEEDSVQRTAAGAREFWSWGPPMFELRCPALPRLEERLEQELAA